VYEKGKNKSLKDLRGKSWGKVATRTKTYKLAPRTNTALKKVTKKGETKGGGGGGRCGKKKIDTKPTLQRKKVKDVYVKGEPLTKWTGLEKEGDEMRGGSGQLVELVKEPQTPNSHQVTLWGPEVGREQGVKGRKGGDQ